MSAKCTWHLTTCYERRHRSVNQISSQLSNTGKWTYIRVSCRLWGTFSSGTLDISAACTCRFRNRCRICTGRRRSWLYSAGRNLKHRWIRSLLSNFYLVNEAVCLCYLYIPRRWERCSGNRMRGPHIRGRAPPVGGERGPSSSWHRRNCPPSNRWHFLVATDPPDLQLQTQQITITFNDNCVQQNIWFIIHSNSIFEIEEEVIGHLPLATLSPPAGCPFIATILVKLAGKKNISLVPISEIGLFGGGTSPSCQQPQLSK